MVKIFPSISQIRRTKDLTKSISNLIKNPQALQKKLAQVPKYQGTTLSAPTGKEVKIPQKKRTFNDLMSGLEKANRRIQTTSAEPAGGVDTSGAQTAFNRFVKQQAYNPLQATGTGVLLEQIGVPISEGLKKLFPAAARREYMKGGVDTPTESRMNQLEGFNAPSTQLAEREAFLDAYQKPTFGQKLKTGLTLGAREPELRKQGGSYLQRPELAEAVDVLPLAAVDTAFFAPQLAKAGYRGIKYLDEATERLADNVPALRRYFDIVSPSPQMGIIPPGRGGDFMRKMGREGIDIPANPKVDPLIQEAKKYKNTDEFIEANTVPAYHGTNQTFDEFEFGKADSTKTLAGRKAVFFTDSQDEAMSYAKLANKTQSSQADFLEKETNRLLNEITQAEKKRNFDLAEELTTKLEDLENNLLRNDKEVLNVMERNLIVKNFKTVDAKGNAILQGELERIIDQAKKEGYEGLKILNITDSPDFGKPTTQYAVFNPEQIKTKQQLEQIWKEANKLKQITQPTPKTKSLGTVGGEKNVAFLKGGDEMSVNKANEIKQMLYEPKKTSKKIFEKKQSIKDIARQAETEIIDEFAPINNFLKDLGQTELAADINPYKKARLFAGRLGIVESKLRSLRSNLAPVIKHAKDDSLSEYLLAKRIIERADNGFKNPVSKEAAEATLDKLRRTKGQEFAEIEQAADSIYRYSDQLLNEIVDAGIISRESYAAIKAKNQSYVPFDVLEYLGDNVDNLPVGKKSFNVASQNIVKQTKGTEKAVDDPLNALIRKTYNTVDLVERNKVAQSLVNLRKIDDSFEEFIIKKSKDIDTPPPNFEKLSVFEDGVKVDYFVPKNVGEAMKGLNRQSADLITGMMAMSSKLFRTGTTGLNIPFAISNAIRDVSTAMLGAKSGFKAGDYALGLMEAFKQKVGIGSEIYDDFMKYGGGFSGIVESAKDVPKAKKWITDTKGQRVVKNITNPKEILGFLPELTELAPRLGLFTRARKVGKSPLEAAWEARNGTVDFARAGTKMRTLNKWIPYLNARMQGTLRTFQAFKDNPKRALAVTSALSLAPQISTFLYNKTFNPELYDDIPDYVKDTNFVIVLGETENDKGESVPYYVTIPKSDVARMTGNPLEAFMETVYEKDPSALEGLMLEMLSGVSPVDFARDGKVDLGLATSSLLPPAFKLPVELATNTNLFTGRNIIPRSLENVNPEEQYTDYTTEFSKKVGEKLNISPIKLDHAIRGIFGSVGMQAIEPGRLGKDLKRKFIRDTGGAKADKFFEILDEVSREEDTKSLKTKRLINDLKTNLGTMTADEAEQAILKVIDDDPRAFIKLVDSFNEPDTDYIDRAVKALGVESGGREDYFVRALQEFETLDEQLDYIGNQYLKKNISKEAMNKLLSRDQEWLIKPKR